MKLSDSSKAVFLMQKMLHIDKMSYTDNSKNVWGFEPKFMEHKLNNFRTKFNKLNAENDNKSKFNIIFFDDGR